MFGEWMRPWGRDDKARGRAIGEVCGELHWPLICSCSHTASSDCRRRDCVEPVPVTSLVVTPEPSRNRKRFRQSSSSGSTMRTRQGLLSLSSKRCSVHLPHNLPPFPSTCMFLCLCSSSPRVPPKAALCLSLLPDSLSPFLLLQKSENSSKHPLYFSQKYTGGTPCDLTQTPRETEVCQPPNTFQNLSS